MRYKDSGYNRLLVKDPYAHDSVYEYSSIDRYGGEGYANST